MPENKSIPTPQAVTDFLAAIPDDERRSDAQTLCRLMAEISGEPPIMWGSSIVGFGSSHYRYDSGREGDWPRVSFSPRKTSLTLYLGTDLANLQDLLPRLGKHKLGKGCLHLTRLADADPAVLRDLIQRSLA